MGWRTRRMLGGFGGRGMSRLRLLGLSDLVLVCYGRSFIFPYKLEPDPNHTSGAIPPISEMQAMLWTLQLLGRLPPLPPADHYHLLASPTARIQYGVDYSSYVYQLATDMRATPSPFQLLRLYGFKVTVSYCMGAAFPAYFRLVGPWKWEGAQDLARGELWDTIKRRGPIGNLLMGVIPILFYGVVNTVAYLVGWVYEMGRWGAGFKRPVVGEKDSMKKKL